MRGGTAASPPTARAAALGVVAREVQIVDRDVDLCHREAGGALDPLDHVVTHGLRNPRDRFAVLDHDRQINSRFALADLDRDTLTTLVADTDRLGDAAQRARDSAAEVVNATHLARRHAGHLRHHRVSDRGVASLRLQRGLGTRNLSATTLPRGARRAP